MNRSSQPVRRANDAQRRRHVVIGRYPRFVEAQAVIDELDDKGVASCSLSIGAEDLRWQEAHDAAERDSWSPIVRGILTGAAFGAVLAVPLSLFVFDSRTWIVAVLWSALFGGFLGALSRVPQILRDPHEDRPRHAALCASCYVVTCDSDRADAVSELMGAHRVETRRGVEIGR